MYVDTETFSTIDITKAGAYRYVEDYELLLAYFKDGDREFVWEKDVSEVFPDWVRTHIHRGGKVRAWNAMFDYLVLKPYFPDLQISQMVDVMAKAQACGLPAKLSKCGAALGLPAEKQKLTHGNKLVRLFCTPHKPSKKAPYERILPEYMPQEWEEFRDEYLRLDVESMEHIDDMLPDLSNEEHDIWVDTQLINGSGVPIDTSMVSHINTELNEFVDNLASEFIRLTGTFPTQRVAVMNWCLSKGCTMENLQRQTVEDTIANPKCPPEVKQALTVRLDISHAAFKKYPSYLATVCKDDTVKGTLNYHSATTGRFGGRLIQTQNLAKGNTDAVEAVARIKAGEFTADLVKSAVRGMIYHPDGLTIADWAQIEARGVLWLAKDEDGLDVFRNGMDPYKTMAQHIYGTAYDDITDKQRFVGKQAVLGLGYQMGTKRFIDTVEGYGGTITTDEAQKAVNTYRQIHWKVVQLWKTLEQAACLAIERPDKRIKAGKGISFYRDPETIFLTMQLPSGRSIYYPYPSLDHDGVSYMGMNQQSQWVREKTYGGKWAENAVQGMCRDILCEAIPKIMNAGMRVVTHIHDEIVVVGDWVKPLTEIMEMVPEWAEGLPLEAEAHHVERFKKI